MERAKGIEPSSQPWQGRVLPLNHAREMASFFVALSATEKYYNKFYLKITAAAV